MWAQRGGGSCAPQDSCSHSGLQGYSRARTTPSKSRLCNPAGRTPCGREHSTTMSAKVRCPCPPSNSRGTILHHRRHGGVALGCRGGCCLELVQPCCGCRNLGGYMPPHPIACAPSYTPNAWPMSPPHQHGLCLIHPQYCLCPFPSKVNNKK